MLAYINFIMKDMKLILFLYKCILHIFQKAVEEPLNGMWLLQICIFFLIHYQIIIWTGPQSSFVYALGKIQSFFFLLLPFFLLSFLIINQESRVLFCNVLTSEKNALLCVSQVVACISQVILGKGITVFLYWPRWSAVVPPIWKKLN